jgi:hypothetical protein
VHTSANKSLIWIASTKGDSILGPCISSYFPPGRAALRPSSARRAPPSSLLGPRGRIHQSMMESPRPARPRHPSPHLGSCRPSTLLCFMCYGALGAQQPTEQQRKERHRRRLRRGRGAAVQIAVLSPVLGVVTGASDELEKGAPVTAAAATEPSSRSMKMSCNMTISTVDYHS